jgi:WD40 repeat protein
MNFSQNGNQLATGSADGVLRLWELQSQQKVPKQLIPLIPSRDCLLTISFNRDGKQVAVVSGKPQKNNQNSQCIQENISLFDQQGQQRIYDYPIRKEDSQITRITFSPDDKQLATVSKNGAVKKWPIYTFDELLEKGCDWLLTHSEGEKDLPCPQKNDSR